MLQIWLADSSQLAFLTAKSQAIKAIKVAYDQGGITIPFPIRTLDFGIVGGQALEQSLVAARQDAP